MTLADVNVLIYAFARNAPDHIRYRGWLERTVAGPEPFAVRHWDLFTDLCQGSGAPGSLVADAYHAALAIEHGCEWVTTDRDFARFPGLRWRHPLDGRPFDV